MEDMRQHRPHCGRLQSTKNGEPVAVLVDADDVRGQVGAINLFFPALARVGKNRNSMPSHSSPLRYRYVRYLAQVLSAAPSCGCTWDGNNGETWARLQYIKTTCQHVRGPAPGMHCHSPQISELPRTESHWGPVCTQSAFLKGFLITRKCP
ncbi:hypothetical protein CPB84DRAFT_567926 [Gymnopilus junonius]|uniref:Uncharacterized protein n=1 Tax=Gymnopilus junonius TaxID=109634 RepID=A0A9P5TQR2_GYMJU|nr:hypothetical protein CPB84DRAFT_567926 [Gymnopilus junonius]